MRVLLCLTALITLSTCGGDPSSAPLPSARIEELPLVDIGVRALESCRLSAITFRDEKTGWLADSCGRLFATTDGGIGWRNVEHSESTLALLGSKDPHGWNAGHISFIRWVDADTAIAGGTFDGSLFRTTNGGATWSAVRTVTYRDFHANESVGQRIWLCGESGALVRSDDAGATWQTLRRPFDSGAHCESISFLDESDGWIADSRGGVWGTRDGGESWEPIRAPAESHNDVTPRILRFSATKAWLVNSDGAFETTDDGRTWTPRVPLREGVASPKAVRGSHGTVLESCWPSGYCEPTDSEEIAALGPDSVASIQDDRGITYYSAGQSVRRAQLVTPASGVTERLRHVTLDENAPEIRRGWSEKRLYESKDGGRIWYVTNEAPVDIDRYVITNGREIVKSSDDHIWIPARQPDEWKESENRTLDTFDLQTAVAREDHLPPPANPLDCLQKADAAEIQLSFGFHGCWASGENKVKLSRRATSAGITGAQTDWQEWVQLPGLTAIDPNTARSIARQFADIVARQEKWGGCVTMTRKFAELQWRCGGEPPEATHSIKFESSDCLDGLDVSLTGGATMTGHPERGGYARAIELSRLGRDLLKQYGFAQPRKE